MIPRIRVGIGSGYNLLAMVPHYTSCRVKDLDSHHHVVLWAIMTKHKGRASLKEVRHGLHMKDVGRQASDNLKLYLHRREVVHHIPCTEQQRMHTLGQLRQQIRHGATTIATDIGHVIFIQIVGHRSLTINDSC